MKPEVFAYYDDLDTLCYFTGSYSEFMQFLRDNPEYNR